MFKKNNNPKTGTRSVHTTCASCDQSYGSSFLPCCCPMSTQPRNYCAHCHNPLCGKKIALEVGATELPRNEEGQLEHCVFEVFHPASG